MKGVILGLAPQEQLVDVTHDVEPQDVRGAAFALWVALPHFSPDSIHVAVATLAASQLQVLAAGRSIRPLRATYAEVEPGRWRSL